MVDLSAHLGALLYRSNDKSPIRPTLISLYAAILLKCSEQGNATVIQIKRNELMLLSSIRSNMTYHKSISLLSEMGIIRYEPSYHPKLGSKISLLIRQ